MSSALTFCSLFLAFVARLLTAFAALVARSIALAPTLPRQNQQPLEDCAERDGIFLALPRAAGNFYPREVFLFLMSLQCSGERFQCDWIGLALSTFGCSAGAVRAFHSA